MLMDHHLFSKFRFTQIKVWGKKEDEVVKDFMTFWFLQVNRLFLNHSER